jgi:hypothetical protein
MDSIYAECANETVEPVALSGVYTSKSGKSLHNEIYTMYM